MAIRDFIPKYQYFSNRWLNLSLDSVLKFLCVGIILMVLPSMAIGQTYEYVYDKFTTAQGLPDDYIRDLDFDSKGNIWILTRKGMVKFDGLTFEKVPIESVLPLRDFEIDKNDNLWLNIYFSERNQTLKERIFIYDTDLKKSIRLNDYCKYSDFDNSKEHDIWKDSELNIHLCDDDNNAFSYFEERLTKIFEIDRSYKLDFNNNKAKSFSFVNDINDEISIIEYSPKSKIAIKDKNINFYIWNKNEIQFKCHFDIGIGEKKNARIKRVSDLVSISGDTLSLDIGNRFKCTFIDDEFYFLSKNKLFVYDSISEELFDLSKELATVFTNVDLLNIYSNDGTIWIGTNNGLIKIGKRKNIFQAILNDRNLSVRELVYISPDSLLIASESGVYLYDLKNNEVLDHVDEKFHFYGISQKDSDTYILGLYGEQVFIKDINDLSNSRRVFEHVKPRPLRKYRDLHLNSFIDYTGRIWFTSRRGICYVDEIDTNDDLIYPFNNKLDGISFTDIIQGKSKEHLFYLSDAGLYELNIDSLNYKELEVFKNKVISFVGQDKDDEDIYWIGSRYEGLIKWKYGTNQIEVINESVGLSNNNVHSVFQDNHGRLWISTDYGISVYNKFTKELSIIAEENGIHENEMNRHSYCFANDSLVFYGGINGIIKFNPYEVVLENNTKEIILKSISYFDRFKSEYYSVSVEKDAKEINIDRNQTDTKLIFDIPQNSFSNTLRYIYSSGDNEWLYTQGNSIDLSKLEEGTTNLFVSKKLGINEWSSPKTISVFKAPPFYRNYWFYGLIFLSSSLGVFLYVNNRRVKALKLNRRIQKEVDDKTKELYFKNKSLTESKNLNEQFFTIIGHDLRSPLISLNNVSKSINYLAENEEYNEVKKLSKSIESNSRKSLAIIDRLIDWTEVQKNSMLEFHKVNISKCIKKSIYEHEDFALKRKIQILSEGKDSTNCISNEASLLIVLGNVIANAIKFSKDGGKIEIKFYSSESSTIIEIRDEGIGMEEDQLYKLNNSKPIDPKQSKNGEIGLGMGILLSSEIVKNIQGSLSFKSKLGKGTTAIIQIPNDLS